MHKITYKKIYKFFGFSLIELIVVMTIFSILAGLGFSGYMDTIRVQRRQDAVLALQKAYLLMSNATTTTSSNPCAATIQCTVSSPKCNLSNTSSITFPCLSDNGFYCINNCSTGFSSASIATVDKQYLISSELLVLQALPIIGKGQDLDQTTPTNCQKIYLSDQNNLYPASCVK